MAGNTMSVAEQRMHLLAALVYGRAASCGEKVNYRHEARAVQVAADMTVRRGRELEAYPCYWCAGWHVGRTMTPTERGYFTTALARLDSWDGGHGG